MPSDDKAPILHVVPTEVAETGQYVHLTADALIAGLRALDGDVSRLLESWRGGSADRYREGWSEIKRGASALLDSLTPMAELLGASAEQFISQEEASSDSIGVLNV